MLFSQPPWLGFIIVEYYLKNILIEINKINSN